MNLAILKVQATPKSQAHFRLFASKQLVDELLEKEGQENFKV